MSPTVKLYRGGARRTALLLAAFEQGRKDARGAKSANDPPYKDGERAKAWEWGWRFQREVIDPSEPKSRRAWSELRRQVKREKREAGS